MSFVGGGSDIPGFYETFGGAVLSTTITKYVFVTCNPKFDSGIRISYSRTEEVINVDQIQHAIVRAALKLLEAAGGIEITTIADVPSRGTGLGSSSSFTVGLLNVLHAFQGRYASAARLAEEACRVEIELCSEPIGKQDQYAAAFGGFNLIEFQPSGRVDVTPVVMPAERRQSLEQRIIAFYTGVSRRAGPILEVQTEGVARDVAKQRALRRMTELAYIMKSELEGGNIDSFGEILHENWELKKSLTGGISNAQIDYWYDTARVHGASGGKILGAGAGGFLIFAADEDQHARITQALGGLRRVNFRFEPLGSRIIFYNL
jgi:D-glycero-alpha-D-manno-heptose-7-phosphate kinase